MTEFPPPQRAERLTTARTLPVRSAQRPTQTGKPGHASKIITAGLSTSLVLGIVSYLGNAAKAEARQQAQLEATQALQPTIVPAIDTATTVAPVVVAPGVATPAVAGATPAAATTPPAAAAPAAPQVIPIAVPVPPPPVAAAPQPAAASSGTTTASG